MFNLENSRLCVRKNAIRLFDRIWIGIGLVAGGKYRHGCEIGNMSMLDGMFAFCVTCW
jgi:hypothetical protein